MIYRRLALAALLAVSAVPAAAQTVKAQDPQSVVAALQAEGYAAKLGVDKLGDPLITSAHSGTTFVVYFYNCTANKNCATVQFHAGYDLKGTLPLEKINDWNKSERFARAWRDDEGDPILEMDVDLDDGGQSRALFIDNLQFWVSLMDAFEKHIGFRT